MKIVTVIVGAFFNCWTPFFMDYFVGGVSNVKQYQIVSEVVYLIQYANSFLNLIIYATMALDFQAVFRSILSCRGSAYS